MRRFVKWGASPRAVQALIRAARVRALAEGRAHVAFEDVRHFAPEVLGHRVLLNYDGLAENLSVPGLVEEIAQRSSGGSGGVAIAMAASRRSPRCSPIATSIGSRGCG